MNLKQITKLLFVFSFAAILISCGSDDEYTTTSPSKDAQIYSFSLKVIVRNAQDSIGLPTLNKTRFAIDQSSLLIYNPDSLPYGTKRKKFAAAIGAGPSTHSMIKLHYPNDSVVQWNGEDSLDFSTYKYPEIETFSLNGNSLRYRVDIRIHQVDPDKINWMPAGISLSNEVSKQKTLSVDGDTFYTFSIDNDGLLYLRKAKIDAGNYDPKAPVSGLVASNLLLESITYFNGQFFAIDKDNKGYSSSLTSGGLVWSKANDNVHAILGVIPGATESRDSLLVLTKNISGDYYFATTRNLSSLTEQIKADDDFPASGFSSNTNVDRSDINKNILGIIGGTGINGVLQNRTWLFQFDNTGALRLTSTIGNEVLPKGSNITTFLYNSYLYALVNNTLYKSQSWGYKWTKTQDKEALHTDMPKAVRQSIVIDKNNYIWVFGGVTDAGVTPKQIWKGRLNKLNPKK